MNETTPTHHQGRDGEASVDEWERCQSLLGIHPQLHGQALALAGGYIQGYRGLVDTE